MKMTYFSPRGESLDFTDNPYFWLINVDGLTWAASDISALTIGGVDGDIINNIQAQPRGLVFDLRIKQGVNVEDAKRRILRIIKLKQNCNVEWSQNGRTLTIGGVVEAVEMPRFNNSVTMQISIHCPRAFWEDVSEIITEISAAKNLHYFTTNPGDMLYFPQAGIPLGEYDTSRTRQFVNEGDVAVGMTIEILAYSRVTNPVIYDQNGNFFGVGYAGKPVTLAAGEKIVINTAAGQKSVTKGNANLLEYIRPRSTWLQLEAGTNEFSISSDDSTTDNMTFTLIYKQRYV